MSKSETTGKLHHLSFIESAESNFFESTYISKKFDNMAEKGNRPSSPSVEIKKLAKQTGNKKGSIFYVAHSYPTKVPVEDVMWFILENTKEGATVLDPFCGSGMTGLAAKLTGRNAVVSDIGTLAMHLTYNHIRQCNPAALARVASEILTEIFNEGSEYVLKLGRKHVEINYLVEADVVQCDHCSKKFSIWDALVDEDTLDSVSKPLCPQCETYIKTGSLDKVGATESFVAFWREGSKRLETAVVDNRWRKALQRVRYPKAKRLPLADISMNSNREMYIRCALHLHQIRSIADFYSEQNLNALSRLYSKIVAVKDRRIRAALMFAFTNTAWHGSKLRRYNARGGHRPLTGTLYIPQLRSIGNVYRIFENKIDVLKKYYETLERLQANGQVKLYQRSATNLRGTPDASIDYVFTDPPFGSNIFYADCNILAEAWLGKLTSTEAEAVVNKSLKVDKGGKSLSEYGSLMEDSFKEIARVLKPNGKMHLVFNSTDGDVWAMILSALRKANLKIVRTLSLDKVQKSFKGNRSAFGRENVATTDVIFELVKTKAANVHTIARKKSDAEILNRAWKNYQAQRRGIDNKFLVADFYHYLVKLYSEDNLDISSLDYSDVKAFLDAS